MVRLALNGMPAEILLPLRDRHRLGPGFTRAREDTRLYTNANVNSFLV